MKKCNLFICLTAIICFVSVVSAQNMVPRNLVVMEVGTGAWNIFSFGTALGAIDMINAGHDVAIISNHNSDTFATFQSDARNSYYNIVGFPSTTFDGVNMLIGGSASTSIYPTYLPRYNTAISQLSPYSLNVSYSHTGANYTVTVTAIQVATSTATNPVVHLVLTESKIPHTWLTLN